MNTQSWQRLEAEFREHVAAWAEFNVEAATRFRGIDLKRKYSHDFTRRYSRLIEASSSATAFEQQWKWTIGDPAKHSDIAEMLREDSRRFRQPHRFIRAVMAPTRRVLRHGPNLLKQSASVLEFEASLMDIFDRTRAGIQIMLDSAFYALYVPWKPDSRIVIPDDRWKLLRALAVDERMLRVITPRQFEELIAYIYECFGCRVKLTSQSRDFGADILAWHGGPLDSESLIAVQVKRYARRRKVGLKSIFELHGAIAHYHADMGHLVASSDFTEPVRRFAKAQRIHLVDMAKLQGEIDSLFR